MARLAGGLIAVILCGLVVVPGEAEAPGSSAAADIADVGHPVPEEGRRELGAGLSRRSASRPHPVIEDVAAPVRIAIDEIEVAANIVPLGVDEHGALNPPDSYGDVGWWRGGPEPGERGPAVLAGHVDSTTGPAVLYRLGELERGDVIRIDRRDGSRVAFTVLGAEQHPKEEFPTRKVYGPTRRPTLRLITCAGAFDQADGHYEENLVVFAAAGRGQELPGGPNRLRGSR